MFLFSKKFSTSLWVGFLALSQPVIWGQYAWGDGLSPEVSNCQAEGSVRQTIVFVDNTVMVDGDTSWINNIKNNLGEGTLLPGELVTVIKLTPAENSSEIVWKDCWPEIPPARKAELAKKTYFFSQNPLDAVKEKKEDFEADLGTALKDKIWSPNKRSLTEVARTNKDASHKKSLLRAIAASKSVFDGKYLSSRAVIYSDMLENSDLGSVLSNDGFKDDASLGDVLATNMHHSIIYPFSGELSYAQDPNLQKNISSFIIASFPQLKAVSHDFTLGNQFNFGNELPVYHRRYKVKVHYVNEEKHLDKDLLGKMNIMASSTGELIGSWIDIDDLPRVVRLTGKNGWTCASGASNCSLRAQTQPSLFSRDNILSRVEDVTMDSTGDDGTLSGHINNESLGINFSVVASPIDSK